MSTGPVGQLLLGACSLHITRDGRSGAVLGGLLIVVKGEGNPAQVEEDDKDLWLQEEA
jgi:hypothetical protein